MENCKQIEKSEAVEIINTAGVKACDSYENYSKSELDSNVSGEHGIVLQLNDDRKVFIGVAEGDGLSTMVISISK